MELFLNHLAQRAGGIYFIMPTDCPKDGNMEATVTIRALQILWDKYFKDGIHKFPRSFEVNTDNTAREGVNNTYATLLAFMTATNKFEDCKSARLIKDHTHNELDQRFSSLGMMLNGAGCLEDMEEFRDHILENFQPACGRALHCEVLESTWDFQSAFHELEIHFRGICPSQYEPLVNHVWHFAQRGLTSELVPAGTVIENHHSGFTSETPRDCILLTKQHLHSSSLSQLPVLAMPANCAEKFRGADLKVCFPRCDAP